jgi:hypothetical protein
MIADEELHRHAAESIAQADAIVCGDDFVGVGCRRVWTLTIEDFAPHSSQTTRSRRLGRRYSGQFS